MKDDTISRAAAIDALNGLTEIYLNNLPPTIYKSDAVDAITALPPAQQTTLTADDIKTIRIHLYAFKETLCNQGRWTEAAEYERLIQRLTGEGGQDEENTVR